MKSENESSAEESRVKRERDWAIVMSFESLNQNRPELRSTPEVSVDFHFASSSLNQSFCHLYQI